MHAPRVRLSATENPCSTFVEGARRRRSWFACQAGVVAGALCLLVATGCQQTRLPNLVPTPYDADKRSFNVHDPLPETNIGPDTGARPPGFLQEQRTAARPRDRRAAWNSGHRHERAARRSDGRPSRAPQWVGRRALRWVDRRWWPRPATIGPSSQFYPDAVPRSSSAMLSLLGACVLALASMSVARADPRIDRSVEATAKELVTPEAQQAIDAGLAFLAGRQDLHDGSFGSLASSRRHVAVTALAGMAFLSSGSTPGAVNTARRCKRPSISSSRIQPNGFIFEEGNTGHGPMYDHGFATLFLGEVYGMTKNPRLRKGLERAVQLIINSQNKEGGWRYEPDSKDADLSVTICQIMALRAVAQRGNFRTQGNN